MLIKHLSHFWLGLQSNLLLKEALETQCLTQKLGRLCESIKHYAGVRKALPQWSVRFLRTARAELGTHTKSGNTSRETASEGGLRQRSNRHFQITFCNKHLNSYFQSGQ